MTYTKEERQANRKAWIKALRSGKYKQGRFALRSKSSGGEVHCCLGVACDISKLGAWYSTERRLTSYLGESAFTYLDRVVVLPPEVMNWLGINSEVGSFTGENNRQRRLDRVNDCGASFNEIANIIESEPEGLFIEEKEG